MENINKVNKNKDVEPKKILDLKTGKIEEIVESEERKK